jgi:hypothetical protein
MQYDQHVWDWAEYHSGQDEEPIPGPDTTISQGTKLPARVIAWAKQHDWFHSSTPDGVLIVFDRYTTRDGQYHEHVCVWNDTAQELAAWAGY